MGDEAIAILPHHEVWLTQSWSRGNNHGISGHLFELIDYYYILSQSNSVGILVCEDITWTEIEVAIRAKYDFTALEIQDLKEHTHFHLRPRLLKSENPDAIILFVDGDIDMMVQYTFLNFRDIYTFLCTPFHTAIPAHWKILADTRVHTPLKGPAGVWIEYHKKILFHRLRKLKRPGEFPGYLRTIMVYGTKNCRDPGDSWGEKVSKKYPGYNIMVLCNSENRGVDTESIKYHVVPVTDLWNKFLVYYYTPTRSGDCSPRFLAECRHYNKPVSLDSVVDTTAYMESDPGLRVRLLDIEESWDSLHLREDDEIIDILQGR